MATHRLQTNLVTDGGTVSDTSQTFTADAESTWDVTVADAVTDQQVLAEIDVSTVVSFIIQTDADILVETNDGTTPADTFTVNSGVPYVWNSDSVDTFQLGTDVTAFYLTNSSGSTATVAIRVLYDSTP